MMMGCERPANRAASTASGDLLLKQTGTAKIIFRALSAGEAQFVLKYFLLRKADATEQPV